MTAGIATLLKLVADTVSNGLIVTNMDGRVLWANRPMRALAGCDGVLAKREALGSLPFLGRLAAGERSTRPWTRPDGVQRRLEVSCRELVVDDNGEVLLILYEVADLTFRYEREQQTRRSEQHLFRMEKMARAGTWEWDLETDGVVWSPDLLAAFGYPPEKELDYHEFRSLVYAEDLPVIERTLAEALQTCQPFTYTHRMYLGNRLTQRWFTCYGEIITDEAGKPVRVMGAVHDITEERRARDELAYLADRDPLTSLPNRRSILRHLRERLTDRVGSGALLLVDIDDFKLFNELHGQAAGDEVLREMAPLLTQHTEPRAFVGRTDGDQFALVLAEGGASEALDAARSICETIARHRFGSNGGAQPMSVSVGAVPLRPGTQDEALFAQASAALQRAKGMGKRRAELFSYEHNGGTAPRAAMFTRISEALHGGHLTLDAQPVIDLATGLVVSYELLMRLRDAVAPALKPRDFLPLLGRSELINELDRWVIGQAAKALSEHRPADPELRISVNISVRSLLDPDFGDFVVDALRNHGVAPARLSLEVAETAAITNPEALGHLVEGLSRAGCRFILDDFSAGLGSFVHLRHLPISEVKITGGFFRHADWTRTDDLLVGSVVNTARGLGLRTTAKHVGHDGLIDTLRRLGIHQGQSYHLGAPRALHELLRADYSLAAAEW